MEKIVFHIDVNNAFLSWTAVDMLEHGYKQDIRKIPSVIGGDEEKRHGIVLAKSPVAKRYGIKTAETLYTARKKCPDVQVFPADYNLYMKKSRELFDYLKTFTPGFYPFSVDEAFLDMSNMGYVYKDVIKLAYKIKNEVKEKFGFTVNIGIGNNNLCAKMASDFEKPDKVHTLFMEEIPDKMWPLEVRDLLFVGKQTADRLNKLGIYTIYDLAHASERELKPYFKNQTKELIDRANGIDFLIFNDKSVSNKSISISRTLEKDSINKEELEKMLLEEVNEVGRSLRKRGYYTSVIAVTYRNKDFFDYSHQSTLPQPIHTTLEIYNEVIRIFRMSWRHDYIRNIGVRLDRLTKGRTAQMDLFSGETKEKDDKVQKVLDDINNKFGNSAITLASLKKKNDN